jgi:hypothetical protein
VPCVASRCCRCKRAWTGNRLANGTAGGLQRGKRPRNQRESITITNSLTACDRALTPRPVSAGGFVERSFAAPAPKTRLFRGHVAGTDPTYAYPMPRTAKTRALQRGQPNEPAYPIPPALSPALSGGSKPTSAACPHTAHLSW